MRIKCGTVREDGMVFRMYKTQKSGKVSEYWVTADKWEKHKMNSRAYLRAMPLEKKKQAQESIKKWKLKNRQKIAVYSKTGYERRKLDGKKRIKTDVQKLAQASRVRMRQALKDAKKSSILHIGCSWEDLMKHIESQFTEGMTWENYGLYGWHVDHRIPLASANSIEELLPLLRFENLQPLWASDNLKKGSRF